MKVLLLNPPASGIVIRDYYCSKRTKSNYLFPPLDLLMQSGILARDHQLTAIDAVAGRLGRDECLAAIERAAPEAVLGLWGAATDTEDRAFYQALAERVQAPVFISGEVVLDDPAAWLKAHPYIRGALLRFVSTDLAEYLKTGRPGPELVVREGDGICGGAEADERGDTAERSCRGDFSVGRPRHELFGHRGYHFSFAGSRRFAATLTDFGCPFGCRFCVMSGLGYRLRPIPEVVEEWRWLRERGVCELFVSDQCFGADRARTRELLAAVSAAAPGLGWTTFTRADLLEEDLLAAMKASGCHTLIMGVETADEKTLASYRKGLSLDRVRKGFALCRGMEIQSVATFIIGLPEDTEETIRATMRLARELDPDFVSYNVAVPRAGTALKRMAAAEGLAVPGVDPDQAGDCVAMRTRSLAAVEVARLKREAVRDFYLRPGYLLRRSWRALARGALWAEVREGAYLLWKNR